MAQILFANPNSSLACSAGIDTAIAPFRFPGGPTFTVATNTHGPPGIYSWRDWHSVAEPLCRQAETAEAAVFVIACASDPAIEAVRAATATPVLGIFRSAVAAAMLRAERFGVIALVDASIGRHARALRSMGVEARLAGEIPMNLSIESLLDPVAARAGLLAAARALAAQGAGAIVLGCTGMAGHRAALEQAAGVPVIEPCQAAAAAALAIVAAHG